MTPRKNGGTPLSVCSTIIGLLGLALWGAVFAAPPANAEAAPQDQKAACPGWAFFSECLTALSADLDGDGEADRIGLMYSPITRTYQVAVDTKAGLQLAPFEAAVDLKTAKLSLTVRGGNGSGDPRCRLWIDGAWCGYPPRSHEFPSNMLYLSDSVHGDFVIYLPPGSGSGFNNTGQFKVVPALDGPIVKR